MHARSCGCKFVTQSPCCITTKTGAQPHRLRLQQARSTADGPPASSILKKSSLVNWMETQGLQEHKVSVAEIPYGLQKSVNVRKLIAATPIKSGEVILKVPDQLCITLSRVFQDETLAELLTTGKLSELACLALYLMYEKKLGKDSYWYPYIHELDKQRGRGQEAVQSPLLWSDEDVEALLKGSPVLKAIRERSAGVEKEYEELDTVWFMAGSFFRRYPYDQPSESFSLKVFKDAFAVVQSSVVHLQGVELSKRFALVPLGPPMLSYSSRSKSMLTHSDKSKCVSVIADRDYAPGETLKVWCGPQPNSKLFINYGYVDEFNPYDRLELKVSLSQDDPLYQLKKRKVTESGLSTSQEFQLYRDKPEKWSSALLSYLCIAHATKADHVARFSLHSEDSFVEVESLSTEEASLLRRALLQLIFHCEEKIKGYQTSMAQDDAIIESETATPKEKIVAKLMRIEKAILYRTISECDAQLTKIKDSAGSSEIVFNPATKGPRME